MHTLDRPDPFAKPAVAAVAPRRARRLAVPCPETARRRCDDWVRAFAARLAWLGAKDGAEELGRLGRSLYEHYNLLDPYYIAGMVWRRWPNEDGIVVPRASSP
jgi:hypothetical protein